jgi:hypothetical protein
MVEKGATMAKRGAANSYKIQKCDNTRRKKLETLLEQKVEEHAHTHLVSFPPSSPPSSSTHGGFKRMTSSSLVTASLEDVVVWRTTLGEDYKEA